MLLPVVTLSNLDYTKLLDQLKSKEQSVGTSINKKYQHTVL